MGAVEQLLMFLGKRRPRLMVRPTPSPRAVVIPVVLCAVPWFLAAWYGYGGGVI